jgi:thiosulfate/3-mercaptopyruvate sulfurtransferase
LRFTDSQKENPVPDTISRKIIPISFILILFASGNLVCQSQSFREGNATPLPPLQGQPLPGDQERFDSSIVSAGWLKKHYAEVVVLDARKQDAYLKGHLPGAVNAFWTYWANTAVPQGEPGWALILPQKQLAEKIAALGIDGTKPVVIYIDPLTGWGEDGHALWVLQSYGIINARILNGGIKCWIAEGGILTKDKPEIRTVEAPKQIDSEVLSVTTTTVEQNLKSIKLLDVREDKEFAGLKVYGEKRKGRIPGAQHIWFKDFLNSDGTWQTPMQIRARVESVGFTASDEIAVYCTGGIRSGFATVALRVAGFTKTKNYNGSFSEWAGTGRPIDATSIRE